MRLPGAWGMGDREVLVADAGGMWGRVRGAGGAGVRGAPGAGGGGRGVGAGQAQGAKDWSCGRSRVTGTCTSPADPNTGIP